MSLHGTLYRIKKSSRYVNLIVKEDNLDRYRIVWLGNISDDYGVTSTIFTKDEVQQFIKDGEVLEINLSGVLQEVLGL